MRFKFATKSLMMATFYVFTAIIIAWSFKEDFYLLQNKVANGDYILPEEILRIQIVIPSIAMLLGMYYFLKSVLILCRSFLGGYIGWLRVPY